MARLTREQLEALGFLPHEVDMLLQMQYDNGMRENCDKLDPIIPPTTLVEILVIIIGRLLFQVRGGNNNTDKGE